MFYLNVVHYFRINVPLGDVSYGCVHFDRASICVVERLKTVIAMASRNLHIECIFTKNSLKLDLYWELSTGIVLGVGCLKPPVNSHTLLIPP